MFGLGTSELLIIFGLVLVLFGPKKLPELGRSLGRAIRSFKDGMHEVEGQTKEIKDEKTTDVIEESKIKEESKPR